MSAFADIPVEYLCPISHEVMVYPFTTTAGNSYEYNAISQWLERSDVDPMTNAKLANKSLIPNNSLRSSILTWLQCNPEVDMAVARRSVPKPPSSAYEARAPSSASEETALRRILSVEKTFDLSNAKASKTIRVLTKQRRQSISKFGNTYSWDETGDMVKCNDGPWIEAPEPDLFVTPVGVIFFDRTEYLDARVLPGTDLVAPCRYDSNCTNSSCAYAHPFVCKFGTTCRDKTRCKFFHPSADSVVPLGRTFPLSEECRYKTCCSNSTCHFAHPKGRFTVPRQLAKIFVTHSLTLEELETPIEIPLTLPARCTTFQVQGEFVFSFEPYPGPWAKQHYRSVTVQRFDARTSGYRVVTKYELERHYCNCAVAAGRYLVISFWPYEEEAMRTVWECVRLGRVKDKALKESSTEIEALRKEVDELKTALREKEALVESLRGELDQERNESQQLREQLQRLQGQIMAAQRSIASKNAFIKKQSSRMHAQEKAHERQVQHWKGRVSAARSQAFAARREAREQRNKAQAVERDYQRLQRSYEYKRAERLRLLDPIHVYALRDGRDGFHRDDWALVLDYHKGAHELSLMEPEPGSTHQLLEVVEHSTVVQFALHVPSNLSTIGATLPLCPGRLCEAF